MNRKALSTILRDPSKVELRPIARAAGAGVAYFAIAFGAGFALALVRIPILEPRLGARWAELAELPVMLVVITLAAGWVVRRFAIAPRLPDRAVLGLVALALMLAAEFGLVLSLRGMTIGEYFASRDPVSGAAYYASLLFFALLPAAMAFPGGRSGRS
jgi:uncharacterized RDD family membrane protein YckC